MITIILRDLYVEMLKLKLFFQIFREIYYDSMSVKVLGWLLLPDVTQYTSDSKKPNSIVEGGTYQSIN